jgi:hypothetical protein
MLYMNVLHLGLAKLSTLKKNEKMVRKNNDMCLGHKIRLGFMTPTEGVIIQVESCPYKLVDDSSPFKLTKLI